MASPLFSLSPSDKLKFSLSFAGPRTTYLTVSNTSDGPIAYKVKTTQPSWYYVSPNQDVIPVGGSFKVLISLVDEMNKSLLELYVNGTKENLDRHRFQVQAVPLPEALFDEFKDMEDSLQALVSKDKESCADSSSRSLTGAEVLHSPEYDRVYAERTAKYSHLWADAPNSGELSSAKLKVDYIYDTTRIAGDADADNAAVGAADEQRSLADMQNLRDKFGGSGSGNNNNGIEPASLASNVETVRNRLALEHEMHPHAEGQHSLPSSHEAALRELASLRKKHDAVADYTMQLTAERDSMKAKFEALQREIRREDSRRANAQSTSEPGARTETATMKGGSSGRAGKGDAKEESLPGSIFLLAAVVVICYLLGRSSSSANFFYGFLGYGK